MVMNSGGYNTFPCDLCGADEPIEIACARLYTGNQPIQVCGSCGFVYVRERRSSQEIARVWAEEIYGGVYTTVKNPAMMARLTFVAEFLASKVDLTKQTNVCDIGAGEGFFLKYLMDHYGVGAFGIEPSAKNCARLTDLHISNFDGTIEQFALAKQSRDYHPEIVSIMWTLENCLSCMDMLLNARAMLPVGGKLLVATGSRVLVPFKKPLFAYFSRNPADTHCFRFSARSLIALLAKAGFKTVATNRFIDNDILCVLAERRPDGETLLTQRDRPLEVLSFFERWHQDSVFYIRDWEETL